MASGDRVAQVTPSQWATRELGRATSRTHNNYEPNKYIYQHEDSK